jgi:hypothetical protein
MQIRETSEYDAKTLLQIVLDGMKSLRHVANAANLKPEGLRRTYTFQSGRGQTESERG